MTREFYDLISDHYARDRYLSGVTTFVQFSYVRRLKFVMVFVRAALSQAMKARVLDVGTADGYVLRRIYDNNKDSIALMVGNDISSKMLEEARRQSVGYPVTYILRDEGLVGKFDLLMEIGVHIPNLTCEVAWISEQLQPSGYAVITVVNKSSWYSRLKLRNKSYLRDYQTFKTYERILSGTFDILQSRSIGIFIPKLWLLPVSVARPIQTVLEWVSERLIPNMMHERIYLLRLREGRS